MTSLTKPTETKSPDPVFDFSCWFPPLVKQECMAISEKVSNIILSQPITKKTNIYIVAKQATDICFEELEKKVKRDYRDYAINKDYKFVVDLVLKNAEKYIYGEFSSKLFEDLKKKSRLQSSKAPPKIKK